MSFGFGFGFPSWRTLAGGFSPAALFVGGVQGAWYDPSDLSTMFDTSTGTTPVAMPGLGAAVPVGLMLDKSQGLVLGAQYAPSSFVDPSLSWDVFTATTNGFSATKSTAGGTDAAYSAATVVTVLGAWYKIEIDVSSITMPNFLASLSLGYNARSTQATFTASGAKTYVAYVQANVGSGTFSIRVGATALGSITVDAVRVAELPGNHAISFNNTTARPELRARVNLLERSEEFNNAYWTRSGILAFGSGSVVDATTAPDGTVTADLITETATTAVHTIARTGLSLTGSFVYSVSGKANGRFITLSAFAGNGNFAAVTFDLVNGTVTEQSSNGSQAITSAPGPVVQSNGFFRCSVTANFVGVSEIYVCLSDVGNPVALGGQAAIDGRRSYAGNGTSGAYIWGADLRPANIGANVPAYQRIADANTYDTNGFPLYLRFDGIDDSMYTPANLNLSGTDKATVFAGVRKLSDAAAGILAETSANSGLNNGSFYFAAPDSANPRYGFALRGNTASNASLVTFAAPISNVVTALFDIDKATISDEIKGRVNGANVALSSTSGTAGTGNFGTYPLYIGSRNNTTTWFNGHLHGLIVVGSAVNAGNISATENWMAGKTGLVLP